jgi:hypothetical protein
VSSNIEIIKVLLEHGADPSVRDDDDRLPLDMFYKPDANPSKIQEIKDLLERYRDTSDVSVYVLKEPDCI